MEQNQFKGKWNDAKGEIRNQWGKLTGDELDQTKGNLTSIAGIIQQKYGHAKEEVMNKLNDISSRFSGDSSDSGSSNPTEDLKNGLRKEHYGDDRKAV